MVPPVRARDDDEVCMRTKISALLVTVLLLAGVMSAFAESKPTVYVIQKGDTLWGLSDRFIKDPGYWPNLWAHNPFITNPHLVFPGQKVRVYADRIEVEPAPVQNPTEQVNSAAAPAEPAPPERLFTVRKGTASLIEKEVEPTGRIIATYQNRQMVAEDDIVYTDIGKQYGAKVGDRFAIFRNGGVVSHPKTNVIVGRRAIPLGVLELVEVEAKASKAVIITSLMEIGTGAELMPYREGNRAVALKAASRELSGFIIDTQTGDKIVAAGDVVFIDLGAQYGVEVGNLLYICRDVEIDKQYRNRFDKVPQEVLGALVVVERGQNSATALIIKSVDAISAGDRVELKKSN